MFIIQPTASFLYACRLYLTIGVALSKFLDKKTAKITKMAKKLVKVVRKDELAKKRGKKDPKQKLKANKSGIPTKK